MNKLYRVNTTFESYQALIDFFHNNKENSDIHFEIQGFFAANMSAILGAILDKFSSNLQNFDFTVSPKIEAILCKNDFLTYYGQKRIIDTNHTTIKYQKLKPTDGKYFKAYIIEELIEGHATDLPKMSQGVKEKIIEVIYEIFENAKIHSNTEFIYTCGQFYPNKNKIEFTIVDTGIGFKNKINQRFDRTLTACQAIKWAIQDKHTTKEGISGGIGLAMLKEFIQMNKGTMQIISNDGFYQYDCDGEISTHFNTEFPGTIVNLQFKTDDSSNYLLKKEIDTENIF